MGEFNTTIDQRAYARVAIVGLGATGHSVLTQQVEQIENIIAKNPDAPPLVEFQIYNDGGDDGMGVPYDVQRMHMLLNFPMQCEPNRYNVPTGVDHTTLSKVGMHILDSDPDDLVQWLEETRNKITPTGAANAKKIYDGHIANGWSDARIAYTDPKNYFLYHMTAEGDDRWTAACFLPRAVYGTYLADHFGSIRERVNAINTAYGAEIVKLNPVADTFVKNVDTGGGDYCLHVTSGEVKNSDPGDIARLQRGWQTDSLVLATGHYGTDLFPRALRETPHFADTPLSDLEVTRAVGGQTESNNRVVIAGTGASYIDVLRELEAIEYKGEILAVSSDPLHYWPYDARKPYSEYDLSSLKEKVKGQDLKTVQKLLVDEVHCDKGIEAGPLNIFMTMETCMTDLCGHLSEEEQKTFAAFAETLSGKKTAPESYKTFRHFVDSGQLKFVSSRIAKVDYDDSTKNYTVNFQERNGKTLPPIYNVNAFIDCAGLATKPVLPNGTIPDPLVHALVQEGMITADPAKGTIAIAPEFNDQIAAVGPAGSPRRGIPYSRHVYMEISRPMLFSALARAEQRREDLGIELPNLEYAA